MPELLIAAFGVDVAVTAAAAWLVVCTSGIRDCGIVEASMAWWLSLVGLVAGAAVILGGTGGLGVAGFLCVHAAVLGVLIIVRRGELHADCATLLASCRRAREFLTARRTESVMGAVLLAAAGALSLLAAWAQPAGADALTYHMPRIGQWLQDGRVHALATQDARMNFVASIPDLVMAWLLGSTSAGFRPAALAQAIGGVMTLGATVGLARYTGLGRRASLMAGALLLGMANVVVQFTSAQTDLFTAGVFAAAFYLWLCALQRRTGSALGGAGAGLALGSKGTLFYLAPGALIWVVFLSWRHRVSWRHWRCTLLAGIGGVALFALPGFLLNVRTYGHALGPKEWVGKLHQGARSNADFLRKLKWNTTSSLAQVFDPQSQPAALRDLGRYVIGVLVPEVPEVDPYTLDAISRRASLRNAFLGRVEPDADVTSFGIVSFVLFSAGTLIALALCRRPEGRLVLVWSGGVAAFLLFFHLMQQWHPFAFRYFVLVAPWIAVVSAWGLEKLPLGVRVGAWVVALGAVIDVGWNVTVHTHQSGWRAAAQPERSLTYYVSSQWGDWSGGLEPADAPLVLALPEERPLAGFYRRSHFRRVSFKADPGEGVMTAEAMLSGESGWVVVPARRFLGREGRVEARVWLFRGDDGSPFSIAAYRHLKVGEMPTPVLYRDLRAVAHDHIQHNLLVRAGYGANTRFRLSNPGSSAMGFAVSTPLATMKGSMPPASERILLADLPRGSVSEVRVSFECPGIDGHASMEPLVELAP